MAKKTKKAAKYVYFFGGGRADGDGKMKPLLGGKGANLHEMTRIGLPVPAGFTVTTELCTYYYENKRTYPKIRKRTGKAFPQNPIDRLWGAMGAVFGSWMNDRAIVYRRKYHIPHEWGTAVNIQTMVFGNLGNTSATGVAFTRDPATGEKVFYGEYLINAQGEDVVAGVRTPLPIARLKQDMPKAHAALEVVRKNLEKHFKDMQDFEFTVEDHKLYMLQTRNGKR